MKLKTIKFSLFSLLFFSLFLSCKTAKNAQDVKLKKAKSSKILMKRLLQNQLSAEWLAAKAKVTIRDGAGVQKFTSYIRWRKDSILWMNFKKYNAEGARIQITPDSIFIVDRLNKQYAVKDFAFAQKEYHLPMGFEGLQSLLLGNPVFFTTDLKSDIDENSYHLAGKTDKYVNEYWQEANTFLLRKMLVEDYRNQRLVEMELGDYRQFSDGRNFSYFRHLNLSSREFGDISIKIELSKLEIDEPKTIRFEIPEHYQEIK